MGQLGELFRQAPVSLASGLCPAGAGLSCLSFLSTTPHPSASRVSSNSQERPSLTFQSHPAFIGSLCCLRSLITALSTLSTPLCGDLITAGLLRTVRSQDATNLSDMLITAPTHTRGPARGSSVAFVSK